MLDVATLLYHICNYCVTRVSQNRTDVKRLCVHFAEKIQFFLKHPAFLSQLNRNKEFENVTVMLHFPSKSAEHNSYRTFLGTFEYVLYCIFLYLYASICIIGFCVHFCGALLCSLLRSIPTESKSERPRSIWHNSSFIKKRKKRPLHKNVQRPLTIQAMLLKYTRVC